MEKSDFTHENCAKIAAKLGIKIIPLHEEIENLTDLIK